MEGTCYHCSKAFPKHSKERFNVEWGLEEKDLGPFHNAKYKNGWSKGSYQGKTFYTCSGCQGSTGELS